MRGEASTTCWRSARGPKSSVARRFNAKASAFARGQIGGTVQKCLTRGLLAFAVKLARGSRQKSRLLPAATKLLSEKSASATFFQWTRDRPDRNEASAMKPA